MRLQVPPTAAQSLSSLQRSEQNMREPPWKHALLWHSESERHIAPSGALPGVPG
jgi:hypothetical protein